MRKLILCLPIVCMSFLTQAANLFINTKITDINDTTGIVKKKNSIPAFIPDGPSCEKECLSSKITFNGFHQNDIITQATDLVSVGVNIEHSFVGDLGMYLVCPNGKKVTLMTYLGQDCKNNEEYPNLPNLAEEITCIHTNSTAYLGVPLSNRVEEGKSETDNCTPELNAKGQGWQYCWSERYLIESQGTIGEKIQSIADRAIEATNYELKRKFFIPDSSFSNLIGCPLNGDWELIICDYNTDNKGWLFEWSLDLRSSYYNLKLAVESISQNSAVLRFENESNKTFVLEYRKAGTATWKSENISGTQKELTGLEENTKYQVRIYYILEDETTKVQLELKDFTTLCFVPNFTIDSITQNEAVVSFENELHKSFVLEYREIGSNEWVSESFFGTKKKLIDLKTDTRYQIHSYCNIKDMSEKVRTDIQTFATRCFIPDYFIESVTEDKITVTFREDFDRTFVFKYKKEQDEQWISQNVYEKQIELSNLYQDANYQMYTHCLLDEDQPEEINIRTTITACFTPFFFIDSVTGDKAIINFDNDLNKSFIFEYRKENTDKWIMQQASGTRAVLSNLDEKATYQIRTYCLLNNGEKRYGNEIKVLTTKAIGIELLPQQEETLFEVFPNPVKDILTIATKGISGNVTIEILDIRGTRLQTQKIICQNNTQEYPISLTHLPKGIYFIQLTHNGYAEVKKVVLQ